MITALALILFIPNPAWCEVKPQNDATKFYQEVHGLEWMEMSAGERMDHLMATMYFLNKNGIELSQAPNYYYDALYHKIERDPNIYMSSISNILANWIYEKEPKSRPALDRFRSKEGP